MPEPRLDPFDKPGGRLRRTRCMLSPMRDIARGIAPVLLLVSSLAGASGVAAAPLCDSAGSHQFDFWIGDWSIRQQIRTSDGGWVELPAHTSVRRALGGCALVEHWRGSVEFFWAGMDKPAPMRGMSVRSFDPKSGKWTIWWMDSMAPSFGKGFSGRFENGKGLFYSEETASDGSQRLARITFSDIQKDSVHWDLASSHDDGSTWKVIWVMDMHRAAPRAPRPAPHAGRVGGG